MVAPPYATDTLVFVLQKPTAIPESQVSCQASEVISTSDPVSHPEALHGRIGSEHLEKLFRQASARHEDKLLASSSKVADPVNPEEEPRDPYGSAVSAQPSGKTATDLLLALSSPLPTALQNEPASMGCMVLAVSEANTSSIDQKATWRDENPSHYHAADSSLAERPEDESKIAYNTIQQELSAPEAASEQRHPLIRQCRMFPDLLELWTPMPQNLYNRAIKRCTLWRAVPLKQAHYNARNERLYLRDPHPEPIMLGRDTLLVLLGLLEPNLCVKDPLLILEAGSPGRRLLEELSANDNEPMRQASLEDLTRYIVQKLAATSAPASNHVGAHEDDTTCGDAPKPSSLEHSIIDDVPGQIGGTNAASQFSHVMPAVAAEAEAVLSSSPVEAPSPTNERLFVPGSADQPDVSGDHEQNALTAAPANMTSQKFLTEDNSICWFLPASPGRGRFVGSGACYLKAIRRASGVSDLFWRSNFGTGADWFLLLIGSHSSQMTALEREKLAYAFRLCKGWAIAVGSEDMLPLDSDIPEIYAQEEEFRLNEPELNVSIDMSFRMRSIPRENLRQCCDAALQDLFNIFDRHRPITHQLPKPHPLSTIRSGVLGELCTEKNSICWIAQGRIAARELLAGGNGLPHLVTNIFGMSAIKVDLNEGRYGQDRCRILVLACAKPQASKTEAKRLLKACRTLVAVIKASGCDSLLPCADNLRPSSLGRTLVACIEEDQKRLGDGIPAMSVNNVSREVVQLLISQLFPSSTSISPAKDSHAANAEVYRQHRRDDSSNFGSIASMPSDIAAHVDTGQPLLHSSFDYLCSNGPLGGPQTGNAHRAEANSTAELCPIDGDYELIAQYAGYDSVHDLDGFSRDVQFLDDGYMANVDEADLYENSDYVWAELSYRKRMELIGSAYWVTKRVRQMMAQMSPNFTLHLNGDNDSVGPSASQVGANTEGEDDPQDIGNLPAVGQDNSGWRTAHEQVEAERAVGPRIQSWTQQVAHLAETSQAPTAIVPRNPDVVSRRTEASTLEVVCDVAMLP